ncbi:MAG: exo-alpha-sialidase, partial [Bacteroidia bacterium]
MKKLLIIFFSVSTIMSVAQTNINISNTSGWDTEPYIAINPTNPNNLVAAWMKLSGFSLAAGTSYSTDGGLTWSAPVAMPHLHANFTSADVSLSFNNSGDVYLCYIDAAISNDSGYVMVAKSTTGGASWGTPVKVMNALSTPDLPVDRPWLAIDKSGGAFNGRLYVVSKSVDIGAMPHHIWMKYSADNGATWSAQTLVDDSIPSHLITNSMGVPAVGADGNLYIGYISYDPPSSPFPRMICLKSTDGGVSFIPKIIGYPASGSGITDTLYQGSYVLSANPSIAGNIVYTFTDQRNGDPDILSVHSNDGGNTWTTTPVRVNDDALSNGVGQDMCWAGFSSTGKYAVVWRDRRNTGGTSSSPFETFATVSTDGGVSFKPNHNLNSTPSPFINIQKGNDFISVCLDDNFIYSDWCDLRTGNTEIFVNKTAMNVFTGISESVKSDELNLKIFPNPTSENAEMTFNVKQKQFLQITLCDVQGKILKTIASQIFLEGKQQLQIITSDLKTGS